MSLASCRCCRGLLHRLRIPRTRPFTTGAVILNTGSGDFKLPTRDWSRPANQDRPRDDKFGRPANQEWPRNDNFGRPADSDRPGNDNYGQGQRRNWGPPRNGNAGGDRNMNRETNRGASKGFGLGGGGTSNRNKPTAGDPLSSGLNKWGVNGAPRDGDRRGGAFRDNASGGRERGAFRDDVSGGRERGAFRDDVSGGRERSAYRDGAPGGRERGAFRDDAPGGRERYSREDSKHGMRTMGDQNEKGATSILPGESLGPLEADGSERVYGKRYDGRDRRDRGSQSLLSQSRAEGGEGPIYSKNQNRRGDRRDDSAQSVQPKKPKVRKPKEIHVKVEKQVYIPTHVSTSNLAKIFGVKLFKLQARMSQLDMSEDQRRPDYILGAEEACNIAIEFGLNPIVDDEASFDIYPDPDPADGTEQPLRAPVVTIMGHVDHGKTTLLDSLRHTSVAASEAGGITQHIGAFSVPLSTLLPSSDSTASSTITFLDTPGHAAFTAMRARGASVTDIVVLVVAADDGVMPQTKEVIDLVHSEGDKVGLVVAINKCDKPGVDLNKIKSALGAEGIFLEEVGGEVPCVEVSGLKKTGLDDLVETLSTLAEVRDLRARQEGKAEGYVLESRIDKGRGNVATVLVTKGTLRTGASIVAGQTWCRVRQMQDDKGKSISEALPGTPVSVTGWKELPIAGDELLEAKSGEEEAKKAINNRKRDEQRKRMLEDVEQINVKRREERIRVEAEAAAAEAAEAGEEVQVSAKEDKDDRKIINLVIKADVSGTVEAVVGSLEHIGNKEAGVKIVSTGVGEVTESDVHLAQASDATVIGFNVAAPRTVQAAAKHAKVSLELESVIYRLIEKVRSNVASLLPPTIEYSVKGEASVIQLFTINLKHRKTATIAGCRVNNGIITRSEGVRVLRGPERTVVFEGSIGTLKHLKKDVTEVRKGMEFGIALEGFGDFQPGDEVVNFIKIEVPREL